MLRSALTAFPKRYVSYLYVPRHKANERVAVLIPYFDFQGLSENQNRFEADCKARNFNGQSSIPKAVSLWKRASNMREEYKILEKQHESMNSRYQECKISGLTIEDDLKFKLKENRQAMKSLSKSLSFCEQDLYNIVLQFPNRIHPRTPKGKEETVIKTVGNPPNLLKSQPKSHITIGHETGSIFFSDVSPNAYYLVGNVAHYELALQSYFMDVFNDFQPFSNPHICKSIVVEGTAKDIADPKHVFLLHNSNQSDELDFHLVGGASLSSFCAYFAKSVISVEELPFGAVTMGRSYTPREADDQIYGLYKASQSSDVSFFVAIRDDDEDIETMYTKCVDTLENAHSKLGLRFQTVICGASRLDAAESSRTEIQLWSPYFQTYFPVASVSSLDDYISKRLLMYYNEDERGSGKYVNLIYGRAIATPVLLASLVENAQNSDFDVPMCLKPYLTPK